MKDKAEVQYTPHASKHSERCAVCRNFRPLYDHCTKVAGKIVPKGWCELFERKTKENS